MDDVLKALEQMNAYTYEPEMKAYYVPDTRLEEFRAEYPSLEFRAEQRATGRSGAISHSYPHRRTA